MKSKKLHYLSALIITLFVGLHLFNHIWSIYGADAHIQLMTTLRRLYRNILIESVLLIVVILQIYSGVQLALHTKQSAGAFFDKLQIWSGLYIAFFLIIHVSAVLVGRLVLKLDTNFYFGVAGIHSYPVNLFFIPYYALAIVAFFGHISSVHSKKMKWNILGFTPDVQAKLILIFGILLTVFIFFGLTNHFKGVTIPSEYQALINNK
jgi:hypothetical protein